MSRRSLSPKFPLIQIILFLFAIAVAALIWFILTARPVDSKSTTAQIFVVTKGDSIDAIGTKLKDSGLIRSKVAFKITVVKEGLTSQLEAGDFRLRPDMTTLEIAQELTHGTLDIWVTLLEGWRREEMAEAIESEFTSRGAEFSKQEFINLTKSDEGYLFPDTYLFPRDATTTTIVSIITSTFDKRITNQMRTDITESNRTLDQVITVASMVEREARKEADRPLVAGILWKRLDADWPLQVDATLQFALGFDRLKDTWWREPSAADKKITSGYNTYQNTGLPPGPISSPSLSSIKAAIYPESSDHWFYLTDLNGNMHYSETIEQHNANISRYLR